MKKLMLILSVFILMVVNHSSIIVHAVGAEKNEVTDFVQIITDNQDERIATYSENGVTTTAIYDKKNSILTIEEPNSEVIIVDLDEVTEEFLDNQNTNPVITPFASTVKENTFMNYEYTITFGSTEKWQLRRPKNGSTINYYYKNVTRNNSNKANLDNFKKTVDNINSLEWKIWGGAITSLGLGWISFILSVPTAGTGSVTTGLAALGAYGNTLNNLVKLHNHAKNAEIYYHRVK